MGLGLLAACAERRGPAAPKGPPRVTGAFVYLGHVITPLDFSDLDGWSLDDHAAALGAFGRSAPLIRRSDVLGGIPPEAWGAPAVPPASARAFFESRFQPVLIEDQDSPLFTGYFEPILEASRVREGIYQTPIHALPPERRGKRRRAPTRKEIHAGALDGRELELFWAADPVEVFFLEIQGSGRIRLPDGTMTRVGYAGQNGHPYYAVGRWLVDEEIIPREEMSAEAIKTWMRADPEAGRALMERNPSYVFFRELEALDPALGPLGAMEVPLTDLRSVAVDRTVHPLGAPLWIETRLAGLPFHRLVVAQDVGGAIKGAQRADIYCGSGERAGLLASAQTGGGRLITLVPRAALLAWVAAGTSPPETVPEPAAETAPEPGSLPPEAAPLPASGTAPATAPAPPRRAGA